MVHDFGSNLKEIPKKTLLKPLLRDRSEDLIEGEFYNGAFKKNLLIFHEGPTRKGALSVITG